MRLIVNGDFVQDSMMRGLRADVQRSREHIENAVWPVDILNGGGQPQKVKAEKVYKEKLKLLLGLNLAARAGVQAIELDEYETALIMTYVPDPI